MLEFVIACIIVFPPIGGILLSYKIRDWLRSRRAKKALFVNRLKGNDYHRYENIGGKRYKIIDVIIDGKMSQINR